MSPRREAPSHPQPVWIVDDDPMVGRLAAEICESAGALPTLFRAPFPFLLALRGSTSPAAVILDWRLENELSSGLFLAVRHRYRAMPVIYWTNSPQSLPTMIRDDEMTLVADKSGGIESLEQAIGWALGHPGSARAHSSES
ncbi:MAG: hypothetical protein ACR2F5_03645 [Candidatus Limnocylindria bacterium]